MLMSIDRHLNCAICVKLIAEIRKLPVDHTLIIQAADNGEEYAVIPVAEFHRLCLAEHGASSDAGEATCIQ